MFSSSIGQEAVAVFDLLDGRLRGGLLPLVAAERFCRAFGGCTVTPSWGCWYDKGELVKDESIRVAVALGPGDWPAFRDLALDLAAGQETVYLISPTGDVFIDSVPAAEEAFFTRLYGEPGT